MNNHLEHQPTLAHQTVLPRAVYVEMEPVNVLREQHGIRHSKDVYQTQYNHAPMEANLTQMVTVPINR